MSLIDDGIKYKSDNKSDVYELVDGETDAIIGFQPQRDERNEKNTQQQNYSIVTEWFSEELCKYFYNNIMLH